MLLHCPTLRPSAAPCCSPAQPQLHPHAVSCYPLRSPLECFCAVPRCAPLRSHAAPAQSFAALLRGPMLRPCAVPRCAPAHPRAALLRSHMNGPPLPVSCPPPPPPNATPPHQRKAPPPPPPPNMKLLRPVTAPGGAGCVFTRCALRPNVAGPSKAPYERLGAANFWRPPLRLCRRLGWAN